MSEDACPFPAEGTSGTALHCMEGRCAWHFKGEEACPHPRACDHENRCLHPVDSHAEWREING